MTLDSIEKLGSEPRIFAFKSSKTHPLAQVEEYRAGVSQSDAFGFFLNRCKQEPLIGLFELAPIRYFFCVNLSK